MDNHLPTHLRRVHALLAGGTARRDALVDDVGELQVFDRILSAWDYEMRPLTYSEIVESCGMEGDDSFDRRFELLTHYGAIIQQRGKASTAKWVPSPLALVSAEILTSLATQSAADRLADLIILALDRLDDADLTAEELLATARQRTRVINVVAAAIYRAADIGTMADLIEARPSVRAQRQVTHVSQIVEIARDRFDEHTASLRELVEASDNFARATDRLGQRLTEQAQAGGVGGLFALLDTAIADTTARTARPDRLASFARDVVFDTPQAVFTPQGLHDAADEIGAPPPSRPDPPVPDPATSLDAVDLLGKAREQARRRDQASQRWVTGLLAADDEAVLTDDVWPTAVRRLVDGLKVATDPKIPVNCELSRQLHVDADASVAVNTPLRLRRLDTAHRHADTTTADQQQPQ